MKDTAARPLVLVVDDEPQMRRLLRVTLEANGYRVEEAATGKDGVARAAQYAADAVLLDLGLPDIDGAAVLKRIREWSKVPVIVLSVRDREDDKISALDAGADDYVGKPFGSGELLARLRTALRHARPLEEAAVFRSGDLEVDFAVRTVRRGEREIKLTATEYALFRLLVQHAGKVMTHRQLLREVWGPNAEQQAHYLRVYVARLRDKLVSGPDQPELIVTEPGVGYRLVVREEG